MKTRVILIFLSTIFTFNILISQNLEVAPNVVGHDIEGNTHDLYQILNSGKSVIIDFMGTLCKPCWDYHQTGVLQELYALHGPDGDNTLEILMIEVTKYGGEDELRAKNGSTLGDWVNGTPYPIIDVFGYDFNYDVTGIPVYVQICPDRSFRKIDKLSLSEHQSSLRENCTNLLNQPPLPQFYSSKREGCGSLTTKFIDQSWPIPDLYQWDFGDFNSSNDPNPVHTYSSPGRYHVKLKVSNEYGEDQTEYNDYIIIGDDKNPSESSKVGLSFTNNQRPFDAKSDNGLIFDVLSPMVLEDVQIYAEQAGNITIALIDNKGKVLNQKSQEVDLLFNTVELDFYIEPGSDYTVKKWDGVFLKNVEASRPVEFPYEIEDLISIKSSYNGATNRYECFFDWTVRKAECSNITNTSDQIEAPLSVYPNPATEFLFIQQLTIGANTFDPIIINSLGQSLHTTFRQDEKGYFVQLNDLPSGLYYIKLGDSLAPFIKN